MNRSRFLVSACAGGVLLVSAASAETPSSPVREIPVTLVTDSTFRRIANWRGLARGAITEGTEDFPEEVGLRLVPGEELRWEPSSYPSLEIALRSATETVGTQDGIVVFFVGRHLTAQAQPDRGYAYLGQPAMILIAAEGNRLGYPVEVRRNLALFFRHELGHVLGIPHLSGNTIMNPSPGKRSRDFGALGWEILRANRTMDLDPGRPFLGSDLEVLRDVYGILAQRGEIETALLVNLAVAFHRERQPEEARSLYELALAREPSLAGRLGLAQCHLALGDSTRTLEMVMALTREPDLTPRMRALAGGLLVSLGEFEDAEWQLTRATEGGWNSFALWFHRGLARFHLDRPEEARQDFERALRLEERPEGWFNLGLTCDALAERGEAAKAFTRYLELAPQGARSEEARELLARQQH